jgi:hypothetical protein
MSPDGYMTAIPPPAPYRPPSGGSVGRAGRLGSAGSAGIAGMVGGEIIDGAVVVYGLFGLSGL